MQKLNDKTSNIINDAKNQKQSLRVQYITAQSLGLGPRRKSVDEIHKPIPISNFLHVLRKQFTQGNGLNSFPVLPSVISAESSSASKTMDGFFLLEASRVDFPDHVVSVNVSSQGLTSVVEEDLSFYTNLQYLDASDNLLNIRSFRSLPSLQELRLTCNNIKDISSDDVNEGLHALAVLDLSYNYITPTSIQNLSIITSLRILDLSGNGLTNLPDEMFQFQNLDKLFLNNNKFVDDKVFVILSYIPRVRYINLSYNYLTRMLTEACESEDQFKWLETFDLSFNYFSQEDYLLPTVNPRKIKEIIIYGNPVLGPTGEDPLQAHVETLVEYGLSPSPLGRQNPVDIITDIPRDEIPKKGVPMGRHAKYRDFSMKKIYNPPMKANREWRNEGNRSIFAEAMAILKKAQSAPGSIISMSSAGDAFFITEVDGQTESNNLNNTAIRVLDSVANELGLNETKDVDELKYQIEVEPVLVNTLIEEADELEAKRTANDNILLPMDILDEPKPSTVEIPQSDRYSKLKINGGYNGMSLHTAMRSLKFAVNHPLTNYDEVPAKGFLPPWSYVQPNEAYHQRKTTKYEPPPGPPPLVVSSYPISSKRKPISGKYNQSIKQTSPSILPQLKSTGKLIMNPSILPNNRQKRLKEEMIRKKTLDQIDEVLTGLNDNTQDIVHHPAGHGHNLKENIEALKNFIKPHTALRGLSTMVDHVMMEIEK